MGQITVSAKTLDEAITKALIELQTTSEHLHYDVIQKATTGIFGLFGGKPCVIRARVMSSEEEKAKKRAAEEKKKEEVRKTEEEKKPVESERKPTEKKVSEVVAPVVTPAPAATPKPVEPDVTRKKQEETSEKYEDRAPVSKKAVERESRYGSHPDYRENQKREYPRKDFSKGSSNQRRETSRREMSAKREEEALRAQKQKELAAEKEARRIAVEVDEEVVKETAKNFLDQVFGAMGMEVEVEPVFDSNLKELQVYLAGDTMGLLIGKRGQTLDSLQYLVSLVVNKKTEGYLRVKLDTENYRERRKETLEILAKNIAYKVKRTRHSVSLEPMNPYERRIIHAALQNDRFVVTRSEGEDPYRHVVISLKRESYGGGNGRRDHYPPKKDNRPRQNRYHSKKKMMGQETESETMQHPVELEVAEPYSATDSAD